MWNKVPKREYIRGNGYAPKKNPDKIINDGVIYDPMGQWKYPGEVTKIPGNTMATHGYGNIPLWVVPDNDPARLVQPNSGQQVFPNSTNFTEYPQLPIAQRGGVLLPGAQGRWLDSVNAQFNNQYGGDPSIPKLNQMKKGGWLEGYSKQTKLRGERGYTSKNIKTSINKLMLRNETLFGPKGKKIYDPLSKFQPGGATATDSAQVFNYAKGQDAYYDKYVKPYSKVTKTEHDSDSDWSQGSWQNTFDAIQKNKEEYLNTNLSETQKNIIRNNTDNNFIYGIGVANLSNNYSKTLLNKAHKKIPADGFIDYDANFAYDDLAKKYGFNTSDYGWLNQKAFSGRGKPFKVTGKFEQDWLGNMIDNSYYQDPEELIKEEINTLIKKYPKLKAEDINNAVSAQYKAIQAIPGFYTGRIYYDPTEVKPWNLRTPQEKIDFVKKHPNQNKNTTKPRQSTQTDTAKPTVAAKTPVTVPVAWQPKPVKPTGPTKYQTVSGTGQKYYFVNNQPVDSVDKYNAAKAVEIDRKTGLPIEQKSLAVKKMGGWLDQYQPGGVTLPKNDATHYYTSDINDPRIKSYNDSVNVFIKGNKDISEFNKNIPYITNNDKPGYYKPNDVIDEANDGYDPMFAPTGYLTHTYNKNTHTEDVGPFFNTSGSFAILSGKPKGGMDSRGQETAFLPIYKKPTQQVYYQPKPKPAVKPTIATPVKENKWGNMPYENTSYLLPESKPVSKGHFDMNKLAQKYYIDDKGKKTWLTESEYEQKRVPKKALGGWLNKYS